MSNDNNTYMKLSDMIHRAEMKAENKIEQKRESAVECQMQALDNIAPDDAADGKMSAPPKRKSIRRTHQIHTRLSDKELAQFTHRVDKSGLPQGEYIRRAILFGEIVISEHSDSEIAILDELATISAELGRQGGMLKMLIRPNEGQRALSPEDWRVFITAIKDLESAKDMVADIKHMVINGDY